VRTKRRRWLHDARAVTAAGAVLASMLAGCTFLISFDEVEPEAEGGVAPPFRPDAPDVRVDAPLPDGSVPDAAKDAPRDAVANPNACKGNLDGKYCGGNQIAWEGGNKDDLVTCKAQVVTGVRLCEHGVGCIRMLNGYADQCDECMKKADGTYCGRDMAGWEPSNANTRVRCQNGAEVGLLLCSNGCTSNGAASVCK
jgi:hypothetical protein